MKVFKFLLDLYKVLEGKSPETTFFLPSSIHEKGLTQNYGNETSRKG